MSNPLPTQNNKPSPHFGGSRRGAFLSPHFGGSRRGAFLSPQFGGSWRGALLVFLCLFFISCIREEPAFTSNTKEGNFEALWTLIDQQYCFFDYKGVDWDAMHAKYQPRAVGAPSTAALFDVMCEMLAELRDGHVNLSYAGEMGRYWEWKENYPANFSTDLQQAYLGTDYHIAAGIKYRMLNDNVAYVVVNSFNDGFGDGNLDYVMRNSMLATGMIIDVRNNSGGNLSDAELLARRFTDRERLVGYTMFKTGIGHNDFSAPEPEYLKPAKGIAWTKPAIVLTNRACYSATNTFVRDMRECPNVTVLGDTTGGGSGLPFVSELPCGWLVRMSTSPMVDARLRHIEFGVPPHIVCPLDSSLAAQGIDSMIETARQLLKNKE